MLDVTWVDPGLRLLTGPEATDLLSAALEPAGGRVLRWSPRDVDCRPGDRTTVSYTATVAWPDGPREETLAASVSATESAIGPAGTDRAVVTDGPVATDGPAVAEGASSTGGLTVTDGDRHVQVWRFPFDPELPGLAGACYPSTVAELLRSLGIDPAGLRLRVVSYRPRKRAVIEVIAGRHRLFLKVLRPRRVADVHGRHRMLTAAGVPVPRSLGWSDDGVMVLDALAGVPLRTALEAGAAPLRPDDLIALLDGLPHDVMELPRRRPWSSHAVHYAEVVSAACPSVASRARALATEIESALGSYDDGDEPTHGDFYDAQLFVAGQALTGLLDIDTLGPGRRADDLACLLAHVSILATSAFDAATGARRALEQWTPAFERRVDPDELRVRAAGVVLSLATGPFRAQEPGWQQTTSERIALVERWLDPPGATGGVPV